MSKTTKTWTSIFILSQIACASSPTVSNHFDGDRFFQPGGVSPKGFFDLIKWQLAGGKKEWPQWRDNKIKPEVESKTIEGELSTTFINHATHLIQSEGVNYLTDPVFSERASPVSFAGPKRVHPPALEIDQLPKIDVVLISHNHYDHMDSASIAKLTKLHDPLFIVPLMNADLIQKMGAKKVKELDWWESLVVADGKSKITLVPAQHWSARGVFDRNKCLWGGFVIESQNFKTFFAGDTGYGPHFSEISKRLGSLDLSILPIGAYEPRWFMKDQHMNPEDAVQAHIDLQSKRSLGTHFGTFQLTDEGIDDPLEGLKLALESKKVDAKLFTAPAVGETLKIKIKR